MVEEEGHCMLNVQQQLVSAWRPCVRRYTAKPLYLVSSNNLVHTHQANRFHAHAHTTYAVVCAAVVRKARLWLMQCTGRLPPCCYNLNRQ